MLILDRNKDILYKNKYDNLMLLKQNLNNYNFLHNDNDLNINLNIY